MLEYDLLVQGINEFILKKGSIVEMNWWTIISSSDDVKMLIQNYSTLAVDDMTIDWTNISWTYVMSNNNWSLTLKWETNVIVPEWKVALIFGMVWVKSMKIELMLYLMNLLFDLLAERLNIEQQAELHEHDGQKRLKSLVNCDPELLNSIQLALSSNGIELSDINIIVNNEG